VQQTSCEAAAASVDSAVNNSDWLYRHWLAVDKADQELPGKGQYLQIGKDCARSQVQSEVTSALPSQVCAHKKGEDMLAEITNVCAHTSIQLMSHSKKLYYAVKTTHSSYSSGLGASRTPV
jgi:hypothetical protein